MTWLDCRDVDSTVALLAGVIGTTPAELTVALVEYDEVLLEEPSEDPWQLVPREILGGFGVDIETAAARFDGACYFHGTRAIDPEAFRRRGILPLDQMLDEIWAVLRGLAGGDISDEGWANFRSWVEEGGGGHDGWLYRGKTGNRIHHGPFGLVVREVFFHSRQTDSHDYLGCPEIVQDIARCFASAHAVDLEQRFVDTTAPCIVKFRSTEIRPGAINAALWYAYTTLRDDEIARNAVFGFDANGVPVATDDVIEVETL